MHEGLHRKSCRRWERLFRHLSSDLGFIGCGAADLLIDFELLAGAFAGAFAAPPLITGFEMLPTAFAAAFAAPPRAAAFGAEAVGREALRKPDIAAAISGLFNNAAIPVLGIAAIPGFCNKTIRFEIS